MSTSSVRCSKVQKGNAILNVWLPFKANFSKGSVSLMVINKTEGMDVKKLIAFCPFSLFRDILNKYSKDRRRES